MSLDIITILLFLLPGMFALLVECSISGYSGKPRSDFEVATSGIIMSIPVDLLSLGIVELYWYIWCKGVPLSIHSISDMNTWINQFQHLALYLASSSLSAFIMGILWASQDRPDSLLIKAINPLRKVMNKAYLSGHSSVWDILVNNQEEAVVSLKTKDGTEIKGFLKNASQSGDDHREIIIHGFDQVERYKGYFDNPKIAYYNFETDTLLTFYDMDHVKEYAETVTSSPSETEAATAEGQGHLAKCRIVQWVSRLRPFQRNHRQIS